MHILTRMQLRSRKQVKEQATVSALTLIGKALTIAGFCQAQARGLGADLAIPASRLV